MVGAAVVAGVLAAVLFGKRGDFSTALHAAPLWLLAIAASAAGGRARRAQRGVARVRPAAGGTVSRRRLYRAASVGYVGTLVNGQVGVAARIAALRRSAPADSPRVPALIAAEIPILTVEAALAALTSFTLVGPLGLPLWLPPLCVGVMVGIGALTRSVSRRHRAGFWRGIAVMRSLAGRNRVVGFVLIAVFAQIARNWLMLHALGIDASVFDSIALLIGMVALSQLPVGPSVGAAAAVLILGADGVAIAAAAGVLLTATGTAGALGYMTWALADRLGLDARRCDSRAPERFEVVPRRMLKDDPLELGEVIPAESQGGLEALGAELPGVQAAAKLVERGAIVVVNSLAARVDQDQMTRPARSGRRGARSARAHRPRGRRPSGRRSLSPPAS